MTSPFVTDGHNSPETVRLQQLMGILKGVSADRQINDVEARNLHDWMAECEPGSEDPTFQLVYSTLEKVLADGRIDAEEEVHLLEVFDRILHPTEHCSSSDVIFAGRKFVLSGNFSFGDKDRVAEIICSRGGEIAKSVSGKVHYVVVGNEGSTAYARGNYGSKVKKAMELQDKGKPIQVISESDLKLE